MKHLLLVTSMLVACNAYSQSGIAWSSASNVAASSYGNMHPRIVMDAAGNPLVVFGSSDGNVKFSRWNGTAFTMPIVLNPSNITAFTATWAGPDVAAKGDTVYAVFKDTPEDAAHHIYIVRSFDGGATFSMPTQVDFINDSISRFPTVAVDGSGNPVVAFMKFNPDFSNARWVVARSNDYGATFQPDVRASGSGGELVCDCCPGSIVGNGNSVAMVYRANLSNLRDTWVAVSSDGGNTFSNSLNIDQHNWTLMSCPASGPDAVVVNDTLYSVFMNGATGSDMVYNNETALSTPVGTTAPAITGSFAGLTQQNYPRIANHADAVAKVWNQAVGGSTQLALYFTTDVHQGFPMNYDTVATGSVTSTDVAVYNGGVFVVWEDDASGTVKYRKGTFAIATALHDLSSGSFAVYPNPASETMTVQLPSGVKRLAVTDLLGRIVVEVAASGDRFELNTASLNAGLYMLSLQTDGNVFTKMFVVKH